MKVFYRLFVCFGYVLWLVGCASIQKESVDLTETDELETVNSSAKVLAAEAITQISPELLKEELDILIGQIQDIHPQPFARIKAKKFQDQVERLRLSLNYPMSRADFYLRVAPLLASLQDVHSYINLPKDQFGEFKYRGEKLFPLATIVEDDKVYVATDLSAQPTVANGAILLSINQAPIDFLLNVMRRLTTRETATGQNRSIQMNFAWLLSAMGYASEVYTIEYLWHGQVFQVELSGLDLPESAPESSTTVAFYGYSKLTSNTGLLWLNDFNESPEVFERFLSETHQQMEAYGVENLILDLRYNSGGLSQNLKNLLSRITDKPIYWAEHGILKVSDVLKKNHRHKTRQRRQAKYQWGLRWLPLEWTNQLQHSIWWAEPGEIIKLELDAIEPSNSYKPERVWVLTNGFCYSACAFFVASVNHFKLGKTIGEEPGSLANFQFAYPITFKLPHSGLSVTLPTMRLDFGETDNENLILPQQIVTRSAADIEARRDPVLNQALMEAEGYY